MMLGYRAGGGEEHALVPVPPPDQIGRGAVRSVDLDDLAVPILIALMASLDRQLVSH
jgi:hypothetical protein